MSAQEPARRPASGGEPWRELLAAEANALAALGRGDEKEFQGASLNVLTLRARNGMPYAGIEAIRAELRARAGSPRPVGGPFRTPPPTPVPEGVSPAFEHVARAAACWLLPPGGSIHARHDRLDAVAAALRVHARAAGPDSHVARDAAAFEQAVAEARGYEALSEVVEALAQLGHDGFRDGTGECPFCTLGQPAELRGLLADHDEGCLMAQAMARFPVHPDGAEAEQCGAAGCTKPPAYPGAIFCGAACGARAEGRR